MAKNVYQIPSSLDRSFLDVEIGLRSSNGVGLHPIPLKTILAFIASGAGCYVLVSNVLVGRGPVWLIVVFVILWTALTFLLFKPDRSGDMNVYRVPALLRYMRPGSRRVTCRRTSDAADFHDLSQFDYVDVENGVVHLMDGGVACAYRVTGSASVLLFEEDREAIIDRVDAFYRNMKCEYELTFVTTRASQDVSRQLSAMERRIEFLRSSGCDELVKLAETERRCLADYVGGQYRSIHQFLVIRADTEESLILGQNMLESEIGNSTLMFKRVVRLFDDELLDVFACVLKGKETV